MSIFKSHKALYSIYCMSFYLPPPPSPISSPSSGDSSGHKMTSAVATLGSPPDRQQEIVYTGLKIIGNGSFGVVYQARLVENNEPVAIKKVLQDKRFKNRELQIMRRLDHCNIIRLQYFFYSAGDKVHL